MMPICINRYDVEKLLKDKILKILETPEFENSEVNKNKVERYFDTNTDFYYDYDEVYRPGNDMFILFYPDMKMCLESSSSLDRVFSSDTGYKNHGPINRRMLHNKKIISALTYNYFAHKIINFNPYFTFKEKIYKNFHFLC